MGTIEKLKKLRKDGKINLQQYRTYKGQVLAGNEDACIIGLKRKGLI